MGFVVAVTYIGRVFSGWRGWGIWGERAILVLRYGLRCFALLSRHRGAG